MTIPGGRGKTSTFHPPYRLKNIPLPHFYRRLSLVLAKSSPAPPHRGITGENSEKAQMSENNKFSGLRPFRFRCTTFALAASKRLPLFWKVVRNQPSHRKFAFLRRKADFSGLRPFHPLAKVRIFWARSWVNTVASCGLVFLTHLCFH